MRATHQYAIHMLGLFLLSGAIRTEAHPVLLLAGVTLAAVPMMAELDVLRRMRAHGFSV